MTEFNDIVQEIIAGFQEKTAKIRPGFRVHRRRTATERMKAKMYYRKNKSKIKIWRRRYNQKRKLIHTARKLLKRSKPQWMTRKKSFKPKTFKPKTFKPHFKRWIHKPAHPKPKRTPSVKNFKIKRPKRY